jgi:hypothetical protein
MTDPDLDRIKNNNIKLAELAKYLNLEINPDFCYHVARGIFRMYNEYWIITDDSERNTFDKLV